MLVTFSLDVDYVQQLKLQSVKNCRSSLLYKLFGTDEPTKQQTNRMETPIYPFQSVFPSVKQY